MSVEEHDQTELKRVICEMRKLELASVQTDIKYGEEELVYILLKKGKSSAIRKAINYSHIVRFNKTNCNQFLEIVIVINNVVAVVVVLVQFSLSHVSLSTDCVCFLVFKNTFYYCIQPFYFMFRAAICSYL